MSTPSSARVIHFLRLHAYEADASVLALTSMESVPREAHGDDRFGRLLAIAAHIQIARRLWLKRLESLAGGVGGESPSGAGIDFWPRWTIDRTRWEAADLNRLWADYLSPADDALLDAELRYTSSESVAYASFVHEVLTHVFNHSTYHRGQIARLVNELGGRPASTDFITLTRRRLPE
jgi:uncharacterized damage-inducible protein DinB